VPGNFKYVRWNEGFACQWHGIVDESFRFETRLGVPLAAWNRGPGSRDNLQHALFMGMEVHYI